MKAIVTYEGPIQGLTAWMAQHGTVHSCTVKCTMEVEVHAPTPAQQAASPERERLIKHLQAAATTEYTQGKYSHAPQLVHIVHAAIRSAYERSSHDSEKICAIKGVRASSGMGLADSKEFVEKHAQFIFADPSVRTLFIG